MPRVNQVRFTVGFLAAVVLIVFGGLDVMAATARQATPNNPLASLLMGLGLGTLGYQWRRHRS